MNGYHSDKEWIYKKRWLESRLARAVEVHPVVILTGARQVGKSTLLRNAAPMGGWRYVSLDDLDVLSQAERDPEALWAGTETVVIDEAHRAPGLFLAVKRAVDEKRGMRFVLSGSANFLLLRRISESLAGRAVHFILRPMTWGEQAGLPPPPLLDSLLAGELPPEGRLGRLDPIPLVLKGFLPPLMWLTSREASVEWWGGYVTTYLERDLRDLSQVASLADFRRVMELAALRTGQLVNQTELAHDAGVSQPTVHRYLNLLETSFLLHRVPAFAKSRTKRLIKSPKLYWADPGLAAFLMGHYTEEGLRSSREAGALFENLVLLHLQVLSDLLTPPARIHHWRTVSGREVDFIVEWGRRLVAVEAKLATKARYADARTLELFLAEHEECRVGVLVYCGDEVVRLGEKIIALPWQALAGQGQKED